MDNGTIPQEFPQHTPGAGIYFDVTGRTHYGMTQLEALERRNLNLQRALTEALHENARLNARVRDLEGVQ